MFQYISEIIKNISPKQRVFALFLTLLFIFLITFGGKLITAFSQTDRVLIGRVSRLEKSNQILTQENNELNDIILESQLQCTKDITKLRKQILDEVTMLEKEMTASQNSFEVRRERTYGPPTGGSGNDTVMAMMPPPEPQIIQINDNRQVMSHLKKIKTKLQKDMEETK
jgi:hypothetical protein